MLKLARLPDWERRLVAVDDRHQAADFAWGECDCMLAVADAIDAVTGKDPAKRVRGRYASGFGAAKILRRRKAKSVEDVLAKHLPPIARLMAQRGDVCTVERDGQISAGYVTMHGIAVKSARGLGYVPITEAREAFKVG